MNSGNLYKLQFKTVRGVENKEFPKMKESEKHLAMIGERNSYAKSDPDAMFMRMKEDAMFNGQLKPEYNVQIATENQFITNYGIFQRQTLECLWPLWSLSNVNTNYKAVIVADAGYGSQQNYKYMFDRGMIFYVKYNDTPNS